MPVLADIRRSWSDPRGLIRDKAASPREDRALATLMGSCALIFVAQWPDMARQAAAHPDVPLDARVGGSLMAVIFMLPLFLYFMAWIVSLVGRALGGRASGFAVRMALFQALLAASPLFLLNGLVRGMTGPGPGQLLVGGLALAGFLYLFISMLITVEREGADV
jgi:hypothetical protein